MPRAVEQALLFLCLGILALRTTYTESPAVQTLTLPGNLSDTTYSLTVSGLLIAALALWFLGGIWRSRMVYRVTGMEAGLVLFLVSAVISAFGVSEKRLAINTITILAGPILAAMLLVQLLDCASRIRIVLLTVAALGVVSAFQCAEQFLVSNQITIEQYEKTQETLLGPLGIEPGTFQHFLFEHRLYGRGVRGFFTTGNSAASFAILAALAGLALLLQRCRTDADRPSRLRSWLYPIIALLIILVGLGLTRSKGGILAFVIAAVLFGVLALLRERLARHRQAAWIVSVAAVLIVSLAIGYAAISYGLQRGRLPGGNSMLVRWQYWRASAQMVADHPLTGIGPGNFAHNYTRYKPASAPESVSDPHSFPLSLLAQYGPLGLLGFLTMVFLPIYLGTARDPEESTQQADKGLGTRPLAAITLLTVCGVMLVFRPLLIGGTGAGDIVVILYEATVLYIAPAAAFLIGFLLLAAPLDRHAEKPGQRRSVAVGAALGCAVGGVLIHNLIDFAIFEPGVWATLWTVLACFIAMGHQQRPLRTVTLRAGKTLKPIAAGAALLLVGMYVYFVWQPVYRVSTRAQQGLQAASIGQLDRAHALLDAASEADPLSPSALYVNGRLYLQEADRATTGQALLLEKAMECFRKAIERDPADYKNYEKAGDVAAQAGQYQNAYEWYSQAAERYPGSGRLQLRLAQVAEQLGNADMALRHYRRAIEIEEAFREQFRDMYPEREHVVSRLGQDNYELARRRVEELSR